MGTCYSKEYTQRIEEEITNICDIIHEEMPEIPYERKIQILYYEEYSKYNKYLK